MTTLSIGIQQCSTNIVALTKRMNVEKTEITMLNCTKLSLNVSTSNSAGDACSDTHYALQTIGTCGVL